MLHVDFHTLSAGLARFESVERGGGSNVVDTPEQGVNNDAMHTNEYAGNII